MLFMMAVISSWRLASPRPAQDNHQTFILSYLSPTRSKPEVDWEDIRQIVRLCALKPNDEPFRSLILRYGGEDALRRIQQFRA